MEIRSGIGRGELLRFIGNYNKNSRGYRLHFLNLSEGPRF